MRDQKKIVMCVPELTLALQLRVCGRRKYASTPESVELHPARYLLAESPQFAWAEGGSGRTTERF